MAVELSVTVKALGLWGRHSCHARGVDGVESDIEPVHFITRFNVQSYRVMSRNDWTIKTLLLQHRKESEQISQHWNVTFYSKKSRHIQFDIKYDKETMKIKNVNKEYLTETCWKDYVVQMIDLFRGQKMKNLSQEDILCCHLRQLWLLQLLRSLWTLIS